MSIGQRNMTGGMKKSGKRSTQNETINEVRTCKQCVHHYDEHDKAFGGGYILARCPFKKWSVLLNYEADTCKHWEKTI